MKVKRVIPFLNDFFVIPTPSSFFDSTTVARLQMLSRETIVLAVEYNFLRQHNPCTVREDVFTISRSVEPGIQLSKVVQVNSRPGSFVRRSLRLPFDI